MKNNKLRVILITQGVSRLVKPLLNSKFEVVGVIESAPRNYNDNGFYYSLLRLGSRLYSKLTSTDVSLKFFCNSIQKPYLFMTSNNENKLQDWVKSLKPDVIVVFSMSQLLKENIFSIPKLGTINLHPSYLPDYRGPNPDFWQYYHMEMEPGVTVHYIDKGEDTGEIITQERVHIPLGTKSPERLDKLIGKVGVNLILEALGDLESGKVKTTIQPKKSSTPRARNLKPEEHASIIDWHEWPAERIWHVLRGTELWLNAIPKPKGVYYGQRWVVEELEKFSGQNVTPGTVYRRNGRSCVAVREGCIYLACSFNLKQLLITLFKK